MDVFWKTLAAVLISAILTLMLDRQSRDFSLMVTLAASAMISISAARFLSPVISFLGRLEALGGLTNDTLLVLIKIFGMGIAGEISCSVCSDAGNASLGKGIQFLTNAAIAYLSIPVFSSLMDCVVQILGEV